MENVIKSGITFMDVIILKTDINFPDTFKVFEVKKVKSCKTALFTAFNLIPDLILTHSDLIKMRPE